MDSIRAQADRHRCPVVKKGRGRWLEEHRKDPYVRQARRMQYRSRAVYKLIEIDQRDHLFRPGQTVVDLGAAPGGWSQYAGGRVAGTGLVVAVDLLPVEPLPQVAFIQGDFTDPAVRGSILQVLEDRQVDLVISDMAPNLTGIRATDQARSMELAQIVHEFCRELLKPRGSVLVKLFQGSGTDQYRQSLTNEFQEVMVRKPKASRDNSREFYMLARGYAV